ncbi:MAG TPA: nucleotidyltransferase family protein [Myxococcota bacterium]|nr:nucleotidyltransferase family protein [Myxococcota bacterium]
MLAAGRGRRMGGAKHLLPLAGMPLAEHVLRALRHSSVSRVSIVLAPDDERGRALAARLGVASVAAESPDEGRAASVRAAVRASAPESAAILFALADQPFLAGDDFEALLAAFRADPRGIVRARYAGAPGSPVLFGRAHFAELLALRGKEGGRAVVAAHPELVREVELPPERGRDLDTPEDLANGSPRAR